MNRFLLMLTILVFTYGCESESEPKPKNEFVFVNNYTYELRKTDTKEYTRVYVSNVFINDFTEKAKVVSCASNIQRTIDLKEYDLILRELY